MTLVDILGIGGFIILFMFLVEIIRRARVKKIVPIATRYVKGHVLENYALLNLVEVHTASRNGIASNNMTNAYANMITIKTNFNEIFEIQTTKKVYSTEQGCLHKNKYKESETVEFTIEKYKEDGQWFILKDECIKQTIS